MKTLCIWTALVLAAISLPAAEFFVSIEGDDSHDGLSREQALRSIQKGVDALKTGDTLTILPGEYCESVQRENLGGASAETVIRAALPGTVLLRGDVPAPAFAPVAGRPFVYAADFNRPVQTVNERNTLRMLVRAASLTDLEFLHGGFYHDRDAGKLYVSSTHLGAPDARAYTVSVLGTNGLYLERPQRVVVDGLAATGFNSAEMLPMYPGYRGAWGIVIGRGLGCTIRNCTAFLNGGGIALYTAYTSHGREPGQSNLIDHCQAWANASRFISEGANIAAYSVNHDVIRDCEAYRSGRGIRIYGGIGPGTIERSLTWDADLQIKGGVLHSFEGPGRVDRCVVLGDAHVHNLFHTLVGADNSYHRRLKTPRDNIRLQQETDLDPEREFADPANRDYRLQATSRFRGAAPDGSDRGPYPYVTNVFYVQGGGDDVADGLSLGRAWKTPATAAARLRPGDTLYLAPGQHPGGMDITTSKGGPVSIRGRGREPAVLAGPVSVRGPGSVSFERVRFAGPVTVTGGRDVVFRDCVFAETGEPLKLDGTAGARIEHARFPARGPAFTGCSGVYLAGNVFDGAAQPAVAVDKAEAVVYADYNLYGQTDSVWQVGARTMAISALRPGHERYSRAGVGLTAPAAGPFGTDAGPYRVPDEGVLRVTRPVVHAVTESTVDLEWWTSQQTDCALAWRAVADGPGARWKKERWSFGAYGFSTYSLRSLKPEAEYEFRVRYRETVQIAGAEGGAKELTVVFRTAAAPGAPVSWYVAPDGNDAADGRSRQQALRTVSAASARARAGDTVWIAGGTYTELVHVRSTGTEQRPLTFRSLPGEKVVFDGNARALPHAFMVTGKAYIHLDGFYFTGFGFGGRRKSDPFRCVTSGVINLYIAEDVQVTRCFSDGRGLGYAPPLVGATFSPRLLIRNSVIACGSQGVVLRACHNARLENNVFFRNMIQQYVVVGWAKEHEFDTARNIIVDNPANKVEALLLEIPHLEAMRETNNCYFLRVPDAQRKMFLASGRRLGLADFHKEHGDSGSFLADPGFKGTLGMDQKDAKGLPVFPPDRLSSKKDLDFPDLFATNPKLVERGIGLQPEAFKDFPFKAGVTGQEGRVQGSGFR